MVHGPGIIIGRKGTLGAIHYVSSDYWPHDTTLWSRDLRGNDPRYIYYFLHTINFERFNVGNSNPTLNRNHIHDLHVVIPPLRDQQRIAGMLSVYDDLIENNTRRIALLEQAARLLYEEWFVRLRFPGREHARITDGVPSGWRAATLGDLCDEIRDQVSPDELSADTPYIGLEHMPRRSITLAEWGYADEVLSTKHRYRAGEIIFGKIRPYFHKVGFALTDGVASSDAIVIRPVTPEEQAAVKTHYKASQWHPHQLRHTTATKLRAEFGLEPAQVILGHKTLVATQIYAEKNVKTAIQIMAQVG